MGLRGSGLLGLLQAMKFCFILSMQNGSSRPWKACLYFSLSVKGLFFPPYCTASVLLPATCIHQVWISSETTGSAASFALGSAWGSVPVCIGSSKNGAEGSICFGLRGGRGPPEGCGARGGRWGVKSSSWSFHKLLCVRVRSKRR